MLAFSSKYSTCSRQLLLLSEAALTIAVSHWQDTIIESFHQLLMSLCLGASGVIILAWLPCQKETIVATCVSLAVVLSPSFPEEPVKQTGVLLGRSPYLYQNSHPATFKLYLVSSKISFCTVSTAGCRYRTQQQQHPRV